MQPVLKHNEGETRFEVYFDEDDFHHSFQGKGSIDFDSEEAKQEYMNKFINEELYAFGVVKMEVCKCCCMWSEKDSLWGIHAESAEDALKHYREELA